MGSRKIWTQLEQLQRKRDIFIKLELAKPPFPKHFFQDTPGVKQTGYYKNSTINGTAGNDTNKVITGNNTTISTGVNNASQGGTEKPSTEPDTNVELSSTAVGTSPSGREEQSTEPDTTVEPSTATDPAPQATSESPTTE